MCCVKAKEDIDDQSQNSLQPNPDTAWPPSLNPGFQAATLAYSQLTYDTESVCHFWPKNHSGMTREALAKIDLGTVIWQSRIFEGLHLLNVEQTVKRKQLLRSEL